MLGDVGQLLCSLRLERICSIIPTWFTMLWKKVKVVRDRRKTAPSPQKSYADIRKRDLEFDMDNLVFLKVSPMRGVVCF